MPLTDEERNLIEKIEKEWDRTKTESKSQLEVIASHEAATMQYKSTLVKSATAVVTWYFQCTIDNKKAPQEMFTSEMMSCVDAAFNLLKEQFRDAIRNRQE